MSSLTAPSLPSPALRRRWSIREMLLTLTTAAPVLLTATVLVHPHDTDDARASLTRIGDDDRARWILAHVVEPFAWMAVAVVLVLAGWAASGRGRAIARTGAAMAATGATSLALIVYAHGEAYRFMSEEQSELAAMERLYGRFYDGMPLVGVLAVLFMVGMIVLAVGLFWTRTVPVWAAVAIAATPVAMVSVGESTSPQVAAFVIGIPMIVGLAGSAGAIAAAWSRPSSAPTSTTSP